MILANYLLKQGSTYVPWVHNVQTYQICTGIVSVHVLVASFSFTQQPKLIFSYVYDATVILRRPCIFKIQDQNSSENTSTSHHNSGKWWSEVMGGDNGATWYRLVLTHSSAGATTTCFFAKGCHCSLGYLSFTVSSNNITLQ